jgi:hypothetical protein
MASRGFGGGNFFFLKLFSIAHSISRTALPPTAPADEDM